MSDNPVRDPERLILASASRIRADILKSAGVVFETARPPVDEASIKRAAINAGRTVKETAQLLADAKALSVKAGEETLVLGSDQILAFKGAGFDKCATMEEARERLKLLEGKRHTLINAIAIARRGEVVFRSLEETALQMRPLTDAEIDAYLAAAGEGVLASVGAYEVEGLGARLFSKIEGDYFAVLGLSLFPVLGVLRKYGMIKF